MGRDTWVLGWGDEAMPLEPAELVSEWKEKVSKMANPNYPHPHITPYGVNVEGGWYTDTRATRTRALSLTEYFF